jgi:hypothetical protein
MKSKLAFIAATLAALAAPLQAEVVETKITIALKFYVNNESPVTKGNTQSLNYGTGTIKNSDIISAVNEALFEPEDFYSLKSKILRRDYFDDTGDLLGTDYVIQDKTKSDLFITDLIDFDYLNQVVKYKFNTEKGTGSVNMVSTASFDFEANPETAETEYVSLYGISRTNIKVVIVKSGNLVELATLSAKVGGYGYIFIKNLDESLSGIAEGTIKASGPKVLPDTIL